MQRKVKMLGRHYVSRVKMQVDNPSEYKYMFVLCQLWLLIIFKVIFVFVYKVMYQLLINLRKKLF